MKDRARRIIWILLSLAITLSLAIPVLADGAIAGG